MTITAKFKLKKDIIICAIISIIKRNKKTTKTEILREASTLFWLYGYEGALYHAHDEIAYQSNEIVTQANKIFDELNFPI